jgi:hypothetical protein
MEPKMRELFVEELAEVRGGKDKPKHDGTVTTQACCEEGPFGCCVTGSEPIVI